MAIYRNEHEASGLIQLEFSPLSRGNLAFFTLRDEAARAALASWLTSEAVGQRILTQTMVDGQLMLVTQGDRSPEAILHLLSARGEKMGLHKDKKAFNWWQLRGELGITGQLLQLTSSFQQVGKVTAVDGVKNPAGGWKRKGFSIDIGIFAILNLIANFGNMIYGAQKEPDIKRLHYAKEMVNEQLAPHLASHETLLSTDDQRDALRHHAIPRHRIIDQFNGFATRNSVRFFELGLRYVAALALVIPFKGETLSKGWNLLKAGEPLQALNKVRNPSKLVGLAGLGYITGKTVAWFSKVRDPYDDAKHSWVDRFREDWLFKSGSVIESAAGVALATQAFKDKKIGFGDVTRPDFKPHRDWFGTVGASMFVVAYIARLFAKFGTKDINVKEVIAHTSDTLAKAPAEKLPQLTAEVAAALTDHFADKNMSYGQVYALLRNDLLQFHPTAMRTAPLMAQTDSAKHTETMIPVNGLHAPTTRVEKAQHELSRVQEKPDIGVKNAERAA